MACLFRHRRREIGSHSADKALAAAAAEILHRLGVAQYFQCNHLPQPPGTAQDHAQKGAA